MHNRRTNSLSLTFWPRAVELIASRSHTAIGLASCSTLPMRQDCAITELARARRRSSYARKPASIVVLRLIALARTTASSKA